MNQPDRRGVKGHLLASVFLTSALAGICLLVYATLLEPAGTIGREAAILSRISATIGDVGMDAAALVNEPLAPSAEVFLDSLHRYEA